MVLLKADIPVILDETEHVIVAATDCPLESVVPSLFQLMVM